MARARPIILALDAAGSSCSAAVAVGDEPLAARRVVTAHGQAERLLPLIDAAMKDAGVIPQALDLVAVTIGPGSFTGIRAGLAAARGIALATRARLIGVTGFAAVAALAEPVAATLLVALESRREELFVQLFDSAGKALGEPAAIEPAALAAHLAAVPDNAAAPLRVAGDAADRAVAALAGWPVVHVVPDSSPNATGVLRAALTQWQAGEVEPASPLYLRPPDVTLPRPDRA